MADNGWAAFEQMLKNYGLGELAAWAKQQFIDGKTADEITLALEDQPAFQRKYAAIFDRRKKGLPPVSVTDIMQYRQQALNLEHFYDLPVGMLIDGAYRDIDQKRATTRYLHLGPQLVEPVAELALD